MPATVTRRWAFDMQVCVPANAAIKFFADHANICGTTDGWTIRKQGNTALAGADERVACAALTEHVHIMLDA